MTRLLYVEASPRQNTGPRSRPAKVFLAEFRRHLVLLATFVCLLTKALRVRPVGTGYAVWTGTVLAGMLRFAEPASAARLVFITIIVLAIAGRNLTTG